MKVREVSLPNGLVVSCLQRHEVPIVNLEVNGYLAHGLELNPGDTLFDVGAHIGLFTLAAYEHCKRNLNVYSFEPVPDTLTWKESKHILGAQANVWTEYMKTTDYVEYMVFPRLLALSEVVWSPREKRDWECFANRLPAHFELLDRLHVNYRAPDMEGEESEQ